MLGMAFIFRFLFILSMGFRCRDYVLFSYGIEFVNSGSQTPIFLLDVAAMKSPTSIKAKPL